MKNFISEDDIEQAILQKLQAEPFCYNIIRCDASPDKRETLPDGTGRTDKKQCVLPQVLRESLTRINPGIPQEKLDGIVKDLCRDFSASDMTATFLPSFAKEIIFSADAASLFVPQAARLITTAAARIRQRMDLKVCFMFCLLMGHVFAGLIIA